MTTRAVCIREVQLTIKESVKQLLTDKIDALGLGWRGASEPDNGENFVVTDTEIRGRNGSLIIFKGMQSFNAANIKSLEGMDIAWLEEAQTISEFSWRLLRPTIRKPGSEIWCSWNPRFDTDAVDAFFRGAHPPKDSICIEVNWQDNPWFPDVLRDEMERDRLADPDMAVHVWDGGYEVVSEGAYYARLIANAEKEGRIGCFPYRPGVRLTTGWDIGVDDYAAVWFVQDDGITATVVDYYEVSGDGADDILATALPEIFTPPLYDARWRDWSLAAALESLGRDVPFRYAEHFLPHDVRVREWGAGARSRVQSLQMLGMANIRVGAQQGPQERINAVRDVVPKVRFNLTPRVDIGLKRLRRYRRKFSDALGTYTTPLHDENSHGADAFGEWAINCAIRESKPMVKKRTPADLTYQYDNESGSVVANMSVKELVEKKMREKKLGLR